MNMHQQGRCPFPRGKVMGGTSTINEMLYMRGSAAEYDEWEAMGNQGWNFENILYYFKKSENMREERLVADTKYHSREGPLSVAYPIYKSELRTKYVEAAVLNFGFHETDYNGEQQNGIAYAQSLITGATRMSSSKAFLDPIRRRKNLYIFQKTECIKVLFSHVGGRKQAVGVTCVTDDEEYNVFASKEVILTAGAIGTAKLLLLSGIGPREDLEKLGIPVWVDSPVGQYLADQPAAMINYLAYTTELAYDYHRLLETAMEYAIRKEGLLSAPLVTALGVSNSNDPALGILNGTNLPDGLYLGKFMLPLLCKKINKPVLTVVLNLIVPSSRGTVTLKSSDYKDPPLIDPKYYSDPSDLELLAQELQLTIEYFRTDTMLSYTPQLILPKECNYPDNVTMEFATCFIKYQTLAGMNPSGTARMGPECDPTAVVDPELKVKGVNGFRVIDASIIPRPPRADLTATQVMIGEKGADIVINTYRS